MKRIFTILLACGALLAKAQDTTALRWVGVNENGELNFFKTDSSDLTNYVAGYGTGQGIFMSGKDSLLYGIFDNGAGGSDRNLYKINPFTGATTLVWDLSLPYISSADISADGNTLYVIQGNGGVGTDLGIVSSIDMATGNATMLDTALNDPTSSSYGIEFNPTDNNIYIFEGAWSGNTRVQVFNPTTLVNTSSPMVGWNTQLHGAKWTGSGNKFIVTAGYGCDMLMTDNTANNLVSFYNTCPYHTADLEEFRTLRAKSSNIAICPNTTDSAMISLIYGGTNFSWYKNGVLLPDTNDTIKVFAAGVYRALIEIGTTGEYMWSEPITITHSAVPVVNVTQATHDTLICPSETIVLNGASGGTLKWYRNGTLIPGATASTYAATMSGSYNQLKINTAGCMDSAAVAYVIYDQLTGCSTGIDDQNHESVRLYPNPVDSYLFVESQEMINSIVLYDVVGKEVFRSENKDQKMKLDLSGLVSGIYFVKITTQSGETIKKIQK
ncbi:MAG: T9SS type A sorting domain-containing protein [Bacteroidia bacterium]